MNWWELNKYVKYKDVLAWSSENQLLEEEVDKFMAQIVVGSPEPEGNPSEKAKSVIKLDFRQPESPFKKATKTEKRLKVFLWGPSGCGKTLLALHFPKPAIIDLERGSELYGDQFDFDVLPATKADEVASTIDWLLSNNHDYRSLIIDPVTVYWESLQKKWSDIFLRRNKGGKGFKFEFYDLQPRDWNTIKGELKDFVRKLLALDMNVIVTARAKALYEEGTFMKQIGETFDGEKTLPYLFDIVLQQWKTEDGKYMAKALKDRTNKLPRGPFEISYEVFETAFGAKTIARKAQPVRLATSAQKEKIQSLATEFGITDDQMATRLEAYGAETIDDLTKENAQVILEKLEAAMAARNPVNTEAPEAGKDTNASQT